VRRQKTLVDAAATGAPALTPVSSFEAKAAGENLLHGNRATVDYRAVATTAFTIPPIAGVGLTEEQADKEGLKVEVRTESLSEAKLMRETGTRHGACKMIPDRRLEIPTKTQAEVLSAFNHYVDDGGVLHSMPR
jgi:pyruvate/2-oxoglutarate dehydrogenase complex dihydrolipoamide dehydrogenase (E3) component